ncbi:hypothetical protein GCM10010178_24760 [Lentzea flava]|uniref:Uncharacterized protein n=1 Tax=Lentzea flava TaxID=103732 RepID=A0ABQ2UFY2_9PSEU|nr:hypothetical protein GCM10010178_24760 [Lentzea flava]
MTAAIDTPAVRCGTTSSSDAITDTIAPPSGNACMSADRAVTSRHASSRLNTPATCAAAISPIECPTRWSGLTPNHSSNRYSATSTAKIAGCANPVWFNAS